MFGKFSALQDVSAKWILFPYSAVGLHARFYPLPCLCVYPYAQTWFSCKTSRLPPVHSQTDLTRCEVCEKENSERVLSASSSLQRTKVWAVSEDDLEKHGEVRGDVRNRKRRHLVMNMHVTFFFCFLVISQFIFNSSVKYTILYYDKSLWHTHTLTQSLRGRFIQKYIKPHYFWSVFWSTHPYLSSSWLCTCWRSVMRTLGTEMQLIKILHAYWAQRTRVRVISPASLQRHVGQ